VPGTSVIGAPQGRRDDTDARVEQKQPQHSGDHIGQQQNRLIKGGAANDSVGHHRKQQTRGQSQNGDRDTEHRSNLDRGEVKRISKDGGEVLEPTKQVEIPKASPRRTDCRIACPADQKLLEAALGTASPER